MWELMTVSKLQEGFENHSVESRDARSRTALMVAAESNPNPAIIGKSLEAGANVNAQLEGMIRDSGLTPVMIAARNSSNPEVVEPLLEAGTDQYNDGRPGADRLGSYPGQRCLAGNRCPTGVMQLRICPLGLRF
jgi:ankyrin repeat protein